jgi:hypothetical protein
MLLTLFTNDLKLAKQADLAGINCIGLDLEYIGKRERQGHLKSWISDHQLSDLSQIREQLTNAQLFVRTNPIHPGLKREIDVLIESGVDRLMLPFFISVADAAKFIEFVAGRAEISLLVETATAAVRLSQILKLDGIHDIHIGLNDLHLSLGLNSHFELLQSEFMKMLTKQLRDAGILFGFGGIGRYQDSRLPIPSDLVYAQYAYHGARSALVSRVFTSTDGSDLNLTEEVKIARDRLNYWFSCDAQTLENAHEQLTTLIT